MSFQEDCALQHLPVLLPSRRSFIAAVACGCAWPAALACAGAWPAAAAAPARDPSSAEDERFMRLALDEARQADFPFGAVIVRDGSVLTRGRNLGRTSRDPTAHGEMVAIRRCVADHGGAALSGTTLYTSGEPCAMCMGAILWSRIGRLVYAASVEQLATKLDQIMISSVDLAAKAPFARISITGGVLADEAMQLFSR
ncbi:MAG TPA: nucleoside deaminase [Gemmatimonadales bacterium]|nr:nucleoside deaminase [Gemmatimonadales bacterium]